MFIKGNLVAGSLFWRQNETTWTHGTRMAYSIQYGTVADALWKTGAISFTTPNFGWLSLALEIEQGTESAYLMSSLSQHLISSLPKLIGKQRITKLPPTPRSPHYHTNKQLEPDLARFLYSSAYSPGTSWANVELGSELAAVIAKFCQ